MKKNITFRNSTPSDTTVPAMKTREIYLALMGDAQKVTNQATKSLDTYRSASEILNRTYIALGRKRVAKFTSSGSTKEKINVKHFLTSKTTV